jgi:LuxR family quorum sensing-dependent transcriptional regulator
MPNFIEAFDFIDRVNKISTRDELVAEFDTLLRSYGFLAFCVGNPIAPKLSLQERILVATWPEEWAKLWTEKNYVSSDPVVYQMLAQSTPFRWRDVRARASGIGAEVMDVARAFRFYDGFGIPVRSQSREIMGITMAGEHLELSDRDKACIHLAAIYFHARLEYLLGSDTREKMTLTPRERECLVWVAVGKTDWEVAQILSISEQTIKTHMKKIMTKLGAIHRAQAVAIGIHRGLIDP